MTDEELLKRAAELLREHLVKHGVEMSPQNIEAVQKAARVAFGFCQASGEYVSDPSATVSLLPSDDPFDVRLVIHLQGCDCHCREVEAEEWPQEMTLTRELP